MADQIIESNFGLTDNKNISLIFDGGTILRSKWIAFGYLHHTDISLKYQILKVQLFDKKCTSDNIKKIIQEISEKVKIEHNGRIVGACTDNASNFTSVFLDEDEQYDDITPLGIVRVSCACHTVQLALKDFHDENEYFQDLVKIMNTVPLKLLHKKQQEIDDLGLTGFPPIQK